MKKTAAILLMMFTLTNAQIVYPVTNMKPRSLNHEKLSGPRTGITLATGSTADKLKERFDASPFITQFGWQFEKRFTPNGKDMALLTEFVPLIGGLEQGLFLPSLSWIFGVRGREGGEAGFGANISAAGAAYVIAGGFTKKWGSINFPVTGSLVLSKGGPRYSLLIGFTMPE